MSERNKICLLHILKIGLDKKLYVRDIARLQGSDLSFTCKCSIENGINDTVPLDVLSMTFTKGDVLQLVVRQGKGPVCLLTFFSCSLLTELVKLVIIQTFRY